MRFLGNSHGGKPGRGNPTPLKREAPLIDGVQASLTMALAAACELDANVVGDATSSTNPRLFPGIRKLRVTAPSEIVWQRSRRRSAGARLARRPVAQLVERCSYKASRRFETSRATSRFPMAVPMGTLGKQVHPGYVHGPDLLVHGKMRDERTPVACEDGGEADLMRLSGWRCTRCAADTGAAQPTNAAHRRLSLGRSVVRQGRGRRTERCRCVPTRDLNEPAAGGPQPWGRPLACAEPTPVCAYPASRTHVDRATPADLRQHLPQYFTRTIQGAARWSRRVTPSPTW